MADVLVRIKRDELTEEEVAESILNAAAIYKVLSSTSRWRRGREKLYVIYSTTWEGLPVYTKGKLVREHGVDTFYFLISAKHSVQ
jgi:hypothetical protein